jgi:membrane-associated protein
VTLGIGAAVENVVPPVPADTFVLFGGLLAGLGRADPAIVFVGVWTGNVGIALAVYGLARRYRQGLRETWLGRRVLHPRQLEQIRVFYQRWGTPAIFLSRFLPGVRAVVPVFAGLSRLGFWSVALPMAAASALWYGALVYLGATAGRNWEAIRAMVDRLNRGLLVVTLVVALLAALWWSRSRRRR